MSLWVDKHRPASLAKLDYHKEQAANLKRLVMERFQVSHRLLISLYSFQVQSGDFPHLLISGPSGAGKKTRMVCVLKELYGNGVEKLRIEHMEFVVRERARARGREEGGLCDQWPHPLN